MAEGMFRPEASALPANLPVDALVGAMVRIVPSTLLRLSVFDDVAQVRGHAWNELLPDGSELWHRAFARADVARCADPLFSLGMVNHEFCACVDRGEAFPAQTRLAAPGTGFAVSADGYVLTNYHLVAAEVEHHGRQSGEANGTPVRCAQLRAQVAVRTADGIWTWRDARSVELVANAPESRAIRQGADGSASLDEDYALLRVDPAPSAFLPLSLRLPEQGETLWMAGFPLRSARAAASRERLGYEDADGSLRVATGRVTSMDGPRFVTDIDGFAGNSGSPVIDAAGRVVGMFSRGFGDGARHGVEYGFVQRVQVASRTIAEGLSLDGLGVQTR